VLLAARNACRTEQVSFKIEFDGDVGVDRSKMRREGVPNRPLNYPLFLVSDTALLLTSFFFYQSSLFYRFAGVASLFFFCFLFALAVDQHIFFIRLLGEMRVK